MKLQCQEGLALEFPTYETAVPIGVGTGVSPVWHWSFTSMALECQWGLALEFHPYGTGVPMGVGTL